MCFSMQWIAQILIWAVVIGAAFAILAVILKVVLPKINIPGIAEIVAALTQIIKIVLWALVIIFFIIIAFDLIACLIGMGGGFPHLSPR